MDREDGLEPSQNPALPEPLAAPGLLRSPLLAAGGMAASPRPPPSHLFPLAVSVAGPTSLGLLLVPSFCVFIICPLRLPMFQALCWLMLWSPR